jgi:hypothetical protein
MRVKPRGRAATPRRAVAALIGAAAVTASIATPAALAATRHPFAGSYTGKGSGEVTGTTASGSGTATCRASGLGRSTLSGSAHGVFINRSCVAFDGTAILKSRTASIRLAASGAHACANTTDADVVSFSGTAKVTGGTSTFAGAHGTLPFTGTYLRRSGALTITFRGSITY